MLDNANEVDELLPTSVGKFAFCSSISDFLLQKSQLKPIGISKRRTKRAVLQKRDWAHVIDVNTPLSNFHELVPEMAHKVCCPAIIADTPRLTLCSTPSSWTHFKSRQYIILKWVIRFL